MHFGLEVRCSHTGAATDRPRTLCRSIRRATRPEAFASSTKSREERGARFVLPGSPNGLLHGGEPRVDNPCPGKLFDVRQEAWPQASESVQSIANELVVSAIHCLRSDQFGMLDVAVQPEAVGGAARHRDAHTGAIDIGDCLQGRTGRHQIGRLDLGIGRGKGDRLSALWLRADQADIPDTAFRRIGKRAGRLEQHVIYRHTQTHGDFAGHIGRYTFGFAIRAFPRDEQEVR